MDMGLTSMEIKGTEIHFEGFGEMQVVELRDGLIFECDDIVLSRIDDSVYVKNNYHVDSKNLKNPKRNQITFRAIR